jgi:two-component system chemotaxis sensor kinase CheA
VSSTNNDFDLSQFKDLFVDESQEYLLILNTGLLSLESDAQDTAAVHAMFRAAHSLKGSAAMLGYDALAELAHGAEDVLHKLREGEWQLTSSLANLLFEAIDLLQSLVAAIAADRKPDTDIVAMLQQLRGYTPEEEADRQPPLGVAPTIPAGAKPEMAEHDQAPVMRIAAHHLDTLLNIVTEMVIHRSLLDRLGQRYQISDLDEALNVHDLLVSQLRDAVLEMRMVPIGQVFDRFPRMVRDLFQAQQKEMSLLIEGDDVEMDRAAVEALREPLVHLLRNAIDHGLESPADRVTAGKPPAGTLRLSARRERDTVVIEVIDDGRGMDPQQIAAAAIERGIVGAAAVARMSDEEILALICYPGFSLKKEVTAVSGRGVGMNVVKQQVERLRGSLDITTRPGQGSTFRLRVPINLALISVVLFRVGSETFALPVGDVEQVFELEPKRIERVGDRETLALRGDMLPLRRLGALLNIPDAAPDPRYALLVQQDDQPLGLCVDAVEGHEEVVIKPLPGILCGIPGLSGITILGEGRTVLILDKNL